MYTGQSKEFPIIDSHAHLMELRHKNPHAFEEFTTYFRPDQDLVLDVAIGIHDMHERSELNVSLQQPRWSLGLYPSHAAQAGWQAVFADLQRAVDEARKLAMPRLAAIGEIGIDRYHDYGDDQRELFDAQLSLAHAVELPVSIHCRDAAEECLDILSSHRNLPRGVMHCFVFDRDWAKKFLNLGFHISLAGNVTYPKNSQLHHVAEYVPLEALLIESDSPYLAPQPYRGKTNTPLFCTNTLDFIAALRGMEPAKLAETLRQNFLGLFG